MYIYTQNGAMPLYEMITYEMYCNHIDETQLCEVVSIKKVLDAIKNHIQSIANELKVGYQAVANAFKTKDFFNILKAFGFSMVKLISALLKAVGSFKAVAKAIVDDIVSKDIVAKVKNGTMRADEFIKKYPALKYISGLGIAAFLIWKLQYDADMGDFEMDFDATPILLAIQGKFLLTDLLTTEDGIEEFVVFLAGVASGISFPWSSIIPAGVHLMVLATAWKNSKKPEVQEKIKKAITQTRNKAPKVKIPKDIIAKVKGNGKKKEKVWDAPGAFSASIHKR